MGNNINNISLDLSQSSHIINRDGGLYKIFDNLYINDNIVDKITEILEDLYVNNEFTEFNLHFLIKPNFNKNVKYDIVKLNEHLSQYPSHFLNENITRVYKNTGLINSTSILVFFSLYDINNLNQISKDIFKDIIFYYNLERELIYSFLFYNIVKVISLFNDKLIDNLFLSKVV